MVWCPWETDAPFYARWSEVRASEYRFIRTVVPFGRPSTSQILSQGITQPAGTKRPHAFPPHPILASDPSLSTMSQDGTPVATSAGTSNASQDQRSYGASIGRWSGYVRELFSNPNGPPLGSVEPDKIEEAAREKLKDSPGMSPR